MKRFARVRGLGFILWHSRHEFYHVLLGMMWSWFLREYWHEFNMRWIWLSIFGSLLPDIDHFFYFFLYGKRAPYASEVKHLLRTKQWRSLTIFMERGHKNNTALYSHNYYFMIILLCLSLLSSFIEWRVGVILFGAMVIHYIFDIGDDLMTLGHINPNWKRWGRQSKITS